MQTKNVLNCTEVRVTEFACFGHSAIPNFCGFGDNVMSSGCTCHKWKLVLHLMISVYTGEPESAVRIWEPCNRPKRQSTDGSRDPRPDQVMPPHSVLPNTHSVLPNTPYSHIALTTWFLSKRSLIPLVWWYKMWTWVGLALATARPARSNPWSRNIYSVAKP